ncbi:MAG: MYG1 family protein [Candidatus Aenigmatarchaeota archaeon]
MKEITIVSHLEPRHEDDYLAIALLLTRYPNAKIKLVHPQQIPEEYTKDENTILVDVGMQYEPSLNNFDHHQNKEIPSSVILIAKHFYPEINTQTPFMQAIDIKDRFGIQETIKRGLIKADENTDKKRKVIIKTEITPKIASIITSLVKTLSKTNASYENFINMLYDLLYNTEEFQKALKETEKEEKAFERKLKQVQVIEKNIKIGISKETLAPYHYEAFKRTQIDLLIEANSMNPNHTSLIVNTNSKTKEKAQEIRDKLIENMPLVFKHPTGFIAVVNLPIEEVIKTL